METVDDTEDNNVPESNTETESGDVLKSSEETRERVNLLKILKKDRILHR